MRMLLRHQLKAKEYEDWSMGFVDTSTLPRELDGFVPYSTLRQTVSDETRAKKLIQMFQEGKWRQVVSR